MNHSRSMQQEISRIPYFEWLQMFKIGLKHISRDYGGYNGNIGNAYIWMLCTILKTMRHLFRHIPIILFFSVLSIKGYSQNDHLEPAKVFDNYVGISKEYFDKVFPLLNKGFVEKPFARYTSLPSFSKEYSFSVENKSNEYYIISNTLSKNYWYAKSKWSVKVKSKIKKIDKQFYDLIMELFVLVTGQIRKSEQETMGLDGVTYYFATTNDKGKIIIGEKWSPDENTLMDGLVNVCDNLYSFSVGNKISKTLIEVEIRNLINDLKK